MLVRKDGKVLYVYRIGIFGGGGYRYFTYFNRQLTARNFNNIMTFRTHVLPNKLMESINETYNIYKHSSGIKYEYEMDTAEELSEIVTNYNFYI